MGKLNDKQKQFCKEYLIDLNAKQAAIRAGYSPKTANEQASRLLTNVNVQTYLKKLMDKRSAKTEITAERVLQELAKIGFSDITDYVDVDGNTVIFKPIQKDDKSGAIAEISSSDTKYGTNIKFKLHDKINALDKIARHLGAFYKDKEEEKVNDQQITVITRVVHKKQ